MKTLWHIIASFLLAVAIFIFTESFTASLTALLAGVFVDLDHLLDFWVSEPENPFSIRQFYHMDKYLASKGDHYTFILFHAWEWLIVLAVLGCYFGWPLLLTVFTLSIGLHFLLDVGNLLSRKHHPLSYFIVFRIIKKFRVKNINI